METSGPGISQLASHELTANGEIPARRPDREWFSSPNGVGKNKLTGMDSWKTLFEGSLSPHHQREITSGVTRTEKKGQTQGLDVESRASLGAEAVIQGTSQAQTGEVALPKALRGGCQELPLPIVTVLSGRSQGEPEAGSQNGPDRIFATVSQTGKLPAKQSLSNFPTSSSIPFAAEINSRFWPTVALPR